MKVTIATKDGETIWSCAGHAPPDYAADCASEWATSPFQVYHVTLGARGANSRAVSRSSTWDNKQLNKIHYPWDADVTHLGEHYDEMARLHLEIEE
jgi:hypothetical protein